MGNALLRLLMVEDSEGDYILTRHVLQDIPDFPIEITWKPTYQEGLEAILTNEFDVCTVDYGLGAKSGCDLVQEAIAGGTQTPMILLTGLGSEDTAVKAMQLGAKDYLVKDRISADSLQRALGNALEKSRLSKEIEDKHRALEQANTKLSAKHQEMQSFYHTVSHELKTPLTSATEFTNIMAEGLLGPLTDEQREALQIVQQSNRQQVTMINDLLDNSRLENGKLALHKTCISVGELAQSVVDSLIPSAQNVGITLTAETNTDPTSATVDDTRIRQVVSNLIGNALKFTPSGGTVRVLVENRLDVIWVSVTDTGQGIPQDQLKKVFNRFHQTDEAKDQAKGGLGLGLSICMGLVELHHGDFNVESDLGQGSTFSFSLPITSVTDRNELIHA